MTKNEALQLSIELITKNKLQYYLDNVEYLSDFGKKRMNDYKQAIAILEDLKDKSDKIIKEGF
jgi:hypothetical protein